MIRTARLTLRPVRDDDLEAPAPDHRRAGASERLDFFEALRTVLVEKIFQVTGRDPAPDRAARETRTVPTSFM